MPSAKTSGRSSVSMPWPDDLKERITDDALYLPEGPFSGSVLSSLFDEIPSKQDGMLLAVSGGPDSLALVMLCYAWRSRLGHQIPIYLATVDHGLREEAHAEAEYVGELAQCLALPHAILNWQGDKSSSNLQGKAREARYSLLADHAQSLGVKTIVTAHHMDDQAETFLMRLLRGSSVRGLSAMRPARVLNGLILARPLLKHSKQELQNILQRFDLNWCEDPSNESIRYLRVNVRKTLMPVLKRFGADASHFSRTSERLLRAEEALNSVTFEKFSALMTPVVGRALVCNMIDYCLLAEEFRLRLLQEALFQVAGPGYPCGEQSLISLDQDLVLWDDAERRVRKKTLGACCFAISGQRLWVYREPGRKPILAKLSVGEDFDWQGLWNVHYPDDRNIGALTLSPLGERGRQKLLQTGLLKQESLVAMEALPAGVIDALPSAWQENRLKFVMDLPEIAKATGCPLEFSEKNTRFTKNG
ncbi:tRNA lysidine(34) synthetase TilS [Cohaesibacter gelatinilyticus]|nr:tRNA lysidine(34) synthetase TilS [Cohaesibacter gelatinilyticus]